MERHHSNELGTGYVVRFITKRVCITCATVAVLVLLAVVLGPRAAVEFLEFAVSASPEVRAALVIACREVLL